MLRIEVIIIATVSASLRMFDQMTRPLQQVTQALNLTISAMDNMNNATNRDIRVANSLNAARNSIRRAGAGLQELVNEQDRARNGQDRLNNSFNRGSSSADGLASKIKGLISGYLGFQAVKRGLDLTIGGAARLEQQLITISGMLGNKEVGKAFFNNLNDYANISVYGLKEFSGITRQFIQFTKNTDKLMTLNKTAERLAFLDPTQGLEGAGFALKEMLGGDGMSLKGRFGFGSGEIKSLKESKSMDDFINKFNKLLDKKGATQQALKEFNNSAIAQFNNLKSNIETAFSQASSRVLETLKPLLSAINQGFKNGSFQGFFNGINIGLSLITNGIVGIIDIAKYVGSIFQDNWSIIGPIVYGIATALGVYYLALLAVNGAIAVSNIIEGVSNIIKSISAARSMMQANATFSATVAQYGLNAAILACPIFWIIAGIVLFIFILVQCGVTAEQICGFVGGVFAVLWAGLYNGVAFIWNRIASFAEFFANVFKHPLYSVKALFANIWNNIVGFVGAALNSIVGMAKKVPFLRDLIGDFSIDSFKVDVGPAPADYWKAPKMEFKDFTNEFKYGYSKGSGMANGIANMFNGLEKGVPKSKMPNMDAWNKAQGPGQLANSDPDSKKHLKNIDDKIDVSNEHLKMLRDVANRDYVAKYNTTTLAPNVKVEFGDIKETADANKIAGIITKIMKEEIAALPEGV